MNAIIGVKQGYYKQFPYKTNEDLQIQPNQICYNKYTNADGSIVGLMVIPRNVHKMDLCGYRNTLTHGNIIPVPIGCLDILKECHEKALEEESLENNDHTDEYNRAVITRGLVLIQQCLDEHASQKLSYNVSINEKAPPCFISFAKDNTIGGRAMITDGGDLAIIANNISGLEYDEYNMTYNHTVALIKMEMFDDIYRSFHLACRYAKLTDNLYTESARRDIRVKLNNLKNDNINEDFEDVPDAPTMCLLYDTYIEAAFDGIGLNGPYDLRIIPRKVHGREIPNDAIAYDGCNFIILKREDVAYMILVSISVMEGLKQGNDPKYEDYIKGIMKFLDRVEKSMQDNTTSIKGIIKYTEDEKWSFDKSHQMYMENGDIAIIRENPKVGIKNRVFFNSYSPYLGEYLIISSGDIGNLYYLYSEFLGLKLYVQSDMRSLYKTPSDGLMSNVCNIYAMHEKLERYCKRRIRIRISNDSYGIPDGDDRLLDLSKSL